MFMLRKTHRAIVRRLSEAHLDAIQRQSEEADLRHRQGIKNLEVQHSAEIDSHRGQNIHLTNEIARLKGLLVARDHAEGKPAGSY